MAVLLVAAAGAGIGSAIGGTFLGVSAAAIGWSVGAVVGNMLFAPSPPDMEGPRLGDLTVQTSTEGGGIAEVWGTWRLAGNVIWSTPIQEQRHEEEVGGKGGGGATSVSYTYSASFAVALCEGTITGVRRIWADGKLISDRGDAADAASVVASNSRAAGIRIYTGSETQLADPTIQAHVGAADTPAYRGVAYIVFDGLQLADFANRIPNITVEVVKSGTASLPRRVTTTSMGAGTSGRYDGGVFRSCGQTSNASSLVWTESVFDLAGNKIDETSITHLVSNFSATGCHVGNDPYVTGPMFSALNPVNQVMFASFRSAGGAHNFSELPAGITITTWVQAIAAGGKLHYAVQTASATYIVSWDRDDSSGMPYGIPQLSGPYTAAGFAPGGGAVKLFFDGTYVWLAIMSASTHTSLRKFDTALTQLAEWVDQFAADAAVSGFAVWNDRLLLPRSTTSSTRLYALNAGGTMTLVGTASDGVTAGRLTVVDNLPGVYLNQDGLWDMAGSIGVSTQTLAAVVGEICQGAGLAAGDIDTTPLLTSAVRGYARARPMTARAAIEPLQAYFAFDGVESSGKIKFPTRGGATVATLGDDDLCLGDKDDVVVVSRQQEVELPSEVSFAFADADRDYQPGVVRARRIVTASRQQIQQDFPIVATSQEAARAADVLLRDAWRSRARYQFRLPPRLAWLDPADVISLPVAGQLHTVRLTRTGGAPGAAIACEAVSESQSAYTSAAAGTDAGLWTAQSIGFAGPTLGALLDLPALRDQDDDAGLYLAAAGYLAGWRGAALYKSADDGATWAQAESLLAAAVIGSATAVLATGRTDIFDESNRLTVRLSSSGAALDSATELAVLNGANAAALGAHGRWEIIQYRTATDNGDGTWTLSGLLRGRRGTEWAVGLHAIGDVFVLLSTATLRRLAVQSAEIGAQRHYRFVTIGQALEAVASQPLTYAGVSLEPYAPVRLGGGRDASGNITLTWFRRTRIAGEWRDFADVPLSEAAESYEVEIWDGAGYTTLKRTLTPLTTPTASYTSAQQVTDFGGNQATVYVRVYQLSATTGRGYPLQASI